MGQSASRRICCAAHDQFPHRRAFPPANDDQIGTVLPGGFQDLICRIVAADRPQDEVLNTLLPEALFDGGDVVSLDTVHNDGGAVFTARIVRGKGRP